MKGRIKIITFYEFKEMSELGHLTDLRDEVRDAMNQFRIVGTVILATEGYNASIAGETQSVDSFIPRLEALLATRLSLKASFADTPPFRKVDVKIKPEIVTLKRPVNIALGKGTHVPAEAWNDLISSDDVLLLDTRNDYEFHTGTFVKAINPETEKFSELPEFVDKNLDPAKHRKVAMFCTGGIRCEKFAPYMKSLGFEEVYQLEGGILKYLEVVPAEQQLWNGECYVFDRRVTLDQQLEKGTRTDLSQSLAEGDPE